MSAPDSVPTETSDEWVCAYCIDFTDGGPAEGRVLHRGTLEDCQRTSNLMPGIAYSGDRPVRGARSMVMRIADWESITS